MDTFVCNSHRVERRQVIHGYFGLMVVHSTMVKYTAVHITSMIFFTGVGGFTGVLKKNNGTELTLLIIPLAM